MLLGVVLLLYRCMVRLFAAYAYAGCYSYCQSIYCQSIDSLVKV